LAFTGPGPGVEWVGLIGAALIVFGFSLLTLVDTPRRMSGRLFWAGLTTRRDHGEATVPAHEGALTRPGDRRTRVALTSHTMSARVRSGAWRGARWLLGR
jgi:hypothetical protein